MEHRLFIGDFYFAFKKYDDTEIMSFKEYETKTNHTDYFATVDKKDIEYEDKITNYEYNEWRLYYTAIQRNIVGWLPLNDALTLHSVIVDVMGTGVAFAAKSGTGKSTHMDLWQKLLGDKMTVVNGDKPIVRFFDKETAAKVDENPEKNHTEPTLPDIPYAYGTPWMGKENLGCNMRTPLKHICFIERSETNSVEKMAASDAVNLIFNQVYIPKDPMAAMKTMELVNKLLNKCEIWKIKCNMDPAAAEVAYNAIFG